MNKRVVVVGMLTAGIVLGGWGTAAAGSGAWDTDLNDVNDVFYVDIDGDGTPEGYGLDRNENGVYDGIETDVNEDYRYESLKFDFDFDGYWDVEITDLNEDGVDDATGIRFVNATQYVTDPTGLWILNTVYQLWASSVYPVVLVAD